MTRTGMTMLMFATLLGGAVACSDDDGDDLVADALVYVAGDGQTGTAGTTLPQPLVVEVVNAAGDPVEGVELRWDVPVGTGTLGQSTTNTDAEGRASNTYQLGDEQAQSVRVRAFGLDIGEVVFQLTLTPDDGGNGGGGGEPL